MKIYVASSWKNKWQPDAVRMLRDDGHEVYDFRTAAAFSWRLIDENWPQWTIDQYLKALYHPASVRGFTSDYGHVLACQACLLVLPCGLSSGIEAGIAHGLGKPTAVWIPEISEPELMVKSFSLITKNPTTIRNFFNEVLP